MPELPEVETIVRDLNKKVLSRAFVAVWADAKKIIRKPKSFARFKKGILNKKIKKIERKAKNIIFYLSEGKALLIHQKLTGHLLLGNWERRSNAWLSQKKGPLEDPMNRFLHLIFWLDDGKQLALSDLRKFAKVELWDSNELKDSQYFKSLGPEPLRKTFTFKKIQQILKNEKGKIKQILMDQTVISGIGNIYSDEILFEAKIHPQKEASRLKPAEVKNIYQAIKKILKRAIDLRGESFSDFRDLAGRKGNFDKRRKVYRREGEKCLRCGGIIKRLKMGGRSAHFCPDCQKL